MSIRTIIEINHDYLPDLEGNDLGRRLVLALSVGSVPARLNRGETPEIAPGLRVLARRHHSYKIVLTVE